MGSTANSTIPRSQATEEIFSNLQEDVQIDIGALFTETDANGNYIITLPQTGENAQVEIPGLYTSGLSVEVRTDVGAYMLPADISTIIPDFFTTLANNGLELSDINFKLNFSDRSQDAMVLEAFKNVIPNGVLLSPIIDFTLEVVNAHTGEILINADSFLSGVSRCLNIFDTDSVESDIYAFRFNEESSEFEFVPHRLEEYDGGLRMVIVYNGNSIYTVAQNHVSYSDLPDEHWAVDFIKPASASLLLKPISDDIFGPEQAIGRDEFSNILKTAFSTDWTGEFMPFTGQITREQMAYAIANVMGIQPVNAEIFVDHVDIDERYAGYVDALADLGIIHGMGEMKFAPKDITTRAQAATVVIKALRLSGRIR